MYKILKGDKVIATQPSLRWLKKQKNGLFVMSPEPTGEAIIVNDTIFAVRGAENADGREVVDIVETQGSLEEMQSAATAQNTANISYLSMMTGVDIPQTEV